MTRVYKKLHFTLIELLMAMAIFTIISLIMMRFFSSAQQIYSKVNQKNNLYSDARVALDLISRDLQCAMYNNDNSPQGVFPFWFEKVRDITGSNYYPNNLEQTQINFIVATDMKPSYAQSNLCEIRYSFVPAGPLPIAPAISPYAVPADQSAETDANNNPTAIGEGWLVRSAVYDKLPPPSVPPANANPFWNFYSNPRDSTPGTTRVVDVFSTATVGPNESHSYRTVISGVYELKFTCFVIDPADGLHKTLKSMKADGTLSTNGATGNTAWMYPFIGTPFPVAVKIDISLMTPTDWREWHAAVDRNDLDGAAKIKQQRARTFSKTVFLDNKISY